MWRSVWLAVGVIALITPGAFGWYKWFKVFNSPTGEKYQKLVTQGPFAPVAKEESKSYK